MLAFLSVNVFAQKGDAILGKWLSPSGRGQVEVFKRNNRYFGKISWLKTTTDKSGKPLTDQHNLTLSLRKRPIMGLEVLRNSRFAGGYYDEGTVYDPESGKTYRSQLVLRKNSLKVIAYMGMFPVRTDNWTRVK